VSTDKFYLNDIDDATCHITQRICEFIKDGEECDCDVCFVPEEANRYEQV
jgi:hypothetical protein